MKVYIKTMLNHTNKPSNSVFRASTLRFCISAPGVEYYSSTLHAKDSEKYTKFFGAGTQWLQIYGICQSKYAKEGTLYGEGLSKYHSTSKSYSFLYAAYEKE